jgi:hypothetical protein
MRPFLLLKGWRSWWRLMRLTPVKNGFQKVPKISAKLRAKLHKFYDGIFGRPTGRAFRWSAHLHKKRGFCVRARRGNERALRGGIGSVLSAPIFAPLRLAAASFSVRWWFGKEKPLPAGC